MTKPVPAPAAQTSAAEKPVVPVPAQKQPVAQPTPPSPEAPPEQPADPVLEELKSRRKKEKVVPGSLAAQTGGDPAILQLAHDILLNLRGRRGMKLPRQGVPPLRLQRVFSGRLLDIRKAERWEVNYAHPLMETMLGSALPDAEKAAFMASLVYTAANRELASMTDLDDVKFQQALADHVAQRQEDK